MSVTVHQAWAPTDGRWSRWVKPVLFEEIGMIEADPGDAELAAASGGPRHHVELRSSQFLTLPAADAALEQRILAPLVREGGSYRDALTPDTALVIDLPGAEGTYLGISLASQGFRPIPLYNAIPSPVGLIDYELVIDALRAGADRVSRAAVSAPPAFLLDASRLVGNRAAEPGRFDNRSLCRSSDFPSAAMLASAGISRVIVVASSIQWDLGEVLLAWQREGIALWRLPPAGDAEPFVHRGPGLLRRFVTALFGNPLAPRPRSDGMFGDLIVHSGGG